MARRQARRRARQRCRLVWRVRLVAPLAATQGRVSRPSDSGPVCFHRGWRPPSPLSWKQRAAACATAVSGLGAEHAQPRGYLAFGCAVWSLRPESSWYRRSASPGPTRMWGPTGRMPASCRSSSNETSKGGVHATSEVTRRDKEGKGTVRALRYVAHAPPYPSCVSATRSDPKCLPSGCWSRPTPPRARCRLLVPWPWLCVRTRWLRARWLHGRWPSNFASLSTVQ